MSKFGGSGLPAYTPLPSSPPAPIFGYQQPQELPPASGPPPSGIHPAYPASANQLPPYLPPSSSSPPGMYPPGSGHQPANQTPYFPPSGPPPPGLYPAGSGYPPSSQPPYMPPSTTADGTFPQNQTGYQEDEGRDEDEGEDDEGAPTAPPLESMEKVPGYENLSFMPAPSEPPPTYEESQKGLPPERRPLPSFAEMKPEDVREALLFYVNHHCCYGKGPARQMEFNSIQMTNAFHYKLETFSEKRETAWVFEPYDGSYILDGPMNGPAPRPWDIPALPEKAFVNEQIKLEVPHTAFSRMCHTCGGGGKVQCRRCWGRGKKKCITCHGHGRKRVTRQGHSHTERCTFCHGSGHKRCMTCSGSGRVTCKTCKGNRQLKCYVQLTVTWTNHVDDHVYETTDLPDELIRSVRGEVAFEERQPRVWPVTQFPNQSINEASKNLVGKHETAFRCERILEQRHTVRIVPVTVVHYTWKRRQGEFFVYGLEEKVYFRKYPASCCCGCTIM